MKAERRAGRVHEIHTEIPGRPLNHLMVLCPACPEPGVNIVPQEYKDIPEHLKSASSSPTLWGCTAKQSTRHTCRIDKTLDGNFKQTAGSHTSNNDDIDLIGSSGLYPAAEIMPAYRDRIVTPNDAQKAKAKQVGTCLHNQHASLA